MNKGFGVDQPCYDSFTYNAQSLEMSGNCFELQYCIYHYHLTYNPHSHTGKAYIVSTRDIMEGEEIFYSYGM